MEGVEVLTVHRDARGWVAEPLAPAALAAQRNVHVVVCEPGATRGNHVHAIGTETLSVEGPALVRTARDGRVRDVEVPEGAVYRFTFPPGVAHAIRNTGTRPVVLVAFSTYAHDPAAPDVVHVPLLQP